MKYIPVNHKISTFIKSLGPIIQNVEWRERQFADKGDVPTGLCISLSTGEVISVEGGSSSGMGWTQIRIYSDGGVCVADDELEE